VNFDVRHFLVDCFDSNMSAGSRRARYVCGLIEFLLFLCSYVYFICLILDFEYNRLMALGIIYSISV
jgi:hypothetical protein